MIEGTGGLRKVRVATKGKGKRGGARVIYYYVSGAAQIRLLLISKDERTICRQTRSASCVV
ncbi:MAG: type II toxin-antitoxin system RelE/ParE family toxin [Nitrococcus sp.]|nr:type II toxin-antitoxin system RelE/ParE family toxin [Nitrococcus sp.]